MVADCADSSDCCHVVSLLRIVARADFEVKKLAKPATESPAGEDRSCCSAIVMDLSCWCADQSMSIGCQPRVALRPTTLFLTGFRQRENASQETPSLCQRGSDLVLTFLVDSIAFPHFLNEIYQMCVWVCLLGCVRLSV